MKNALDKDKVNWGYVKGVMQSWIKKGITNVEETKQTKQKKQPIPEKPTSKQGQAQVTFQIQNYLEQKELDRMTGYSHANG